MGRRWRGASGWAFALTLLLSVAFALTPAGTVIRNQAVAEASGERYLSNVAETRVQAVCRPLLFPDGTPEAPALRASAAPGGWVHLPYRLKNGGNAPYTFALSHVLHGTSSWVPEAVRFYLDVNANALSDPGEPEVSEVALGMGEEVALVLALKVPATASGSLFITPVATCPGGEEDGENYARVEASGILEPSLFLAKAASPAALLPGERATFTLTLRNLGTGEARGPILLSDPLAGLEGLRYVPGSARAPKGILEFFDGAAWRTEEPPSVLGVRLRLERLLPGEEATLRKDIEKILTPYGFRNRNDNVRHGYCLGTAVLSPARLREVHNVVQQAAGRLADPSAQDLLAELDERLGWAGISADGLPPVRSYARHAVVDTQLVRRDSLAAPRRAEAIEAAIVEHRRVLLQRYPGVGSFAGSPAGELRVWPLQLIFHNVGWYLLFEEDQVGREQGLIRSERLDRLAMARGDGDLRRNSEQHADALNRLERLLHHSGGIYFGSDLEQQLAVASSSAQHRTQALVTLRFWCSPWAFAFIREGLQRYPIEHTRFSRPLPGDSWWHHPKAPHVLEPGPADASHPYPVELDLPPWTVAADIDLRSWLFAFGGGIRIEQPDDLRQELLQRCQEAMAANGGQPSQTAAADQPSQRTDFANRLHKDRRLL